MRHLLLCLLFGLSSISASAGVYTYIDADGNRVFTDQPPSGEAERIELAPGNQMPSSPAAQASPARFR